MIHPSIIYAFWSHIYILIPCAQMYTVARRTSIFCQTRLSTNDSGIGPRYAAVRIKNKHIPIELLYHLIMHYRSIKAFLLKLDTEMDYVIRRSTLYG